MAFTTGTATHYHDLLDKLRLYLVAQGWTQLAWTPPPGGLSTQATLHIRGPGAGSGQEVYLSFQSETNGTYFNLACRGATGYDSAQPLTNQPNVSTPTYLCSHATTITYWFYVNNRRVIIVTKLGSVYTSAYFGLFLPWGTPAEYPFPLVLLGSGSQTTVPSNSDASFRFFADPGIGAGRLMLPTNTWWACYNQTAGASVNQPVSDQLTSHVLIWPFHQGSTIASGTVLVYYWSGYAVGYTTGGLLDYLAATPQGERVLFPLELFGRPDPGEYGALDGAFCVPGTGLVAEQQLTLGADTYRCFPNINRVSGNDFVAIKEA